MLYLLDTNVLIEAKNLYYPQERIPQFWAWLLWQAELGAIKIPGAILAEIERGSREDDLRAWVKSNRAILELNEDIQEQDLFKTLLEGYGFQPSEMEEHTLAELQADPFLVAYALSDASNRCVVTLEKARVHANNLPNPINRRIPTVCDILGVEYMNTFRLIRELDFKIPLA